MDAPTLASHSEYHGLDTPIGTGIQIIIHQALSGDSLALYASRYGTTVEAIQAVNYQTLSILTPWPPIVIPINAADVSSLPAFDVYQVPDTINVGNLAAQLSVDPALLAASNGLQETDLFMPGEWVLVPR